MPRHFKVCLKETRILLLRVIAFRGVRLPRLGSTKESNGKPGATIIKEIIPMRVLKKPVKAVATTKKTLSARSDTC